MWFHSKRPSNAHDRQGEAHQAQVTHPFHPLHGRTFEVIDRRHGQSGECVYLEVDTVRVERVPTAWTSLCSADPFLRVAAGRSLFRVEDLVRLAELVAQIADVEQAPGGNEGPSDA